jgi:plasmid maintenance system killer protein
MHEPVEDAVGNCWIADLRVPARDRHPRGQEHAPSLVALVAVSQKPRRSVSVSGAIARSSTTSTSIRLMRASKWRKLLNLHGLELHELHSARKGTWAVKVSGNWHVTFSWTDKDADRVDFEDYH